MSENSTLLSYLVPTFSRSVEDTATDTLVYILNKSQSAVAALNKLINTISPVPVEDCIDFSTQVIEDRSRFDLVGYDQSGLRRVIGESKFGAALGDGQGRVYLAQLTGQGNAVLLFVVPDYRLDYLWEEVKKDVVGSQVEHEVLEEVRTHGPTKCAKKKGEDRYLAMVSWGDLLTAIDEKDNNNPDVKYDIKQLRELAKSMDREAFKPLQEGELERSFPSRLRQLQTLVDSAFDTYRAKYEGFITQGYQATSTYDGFVRYFRLERSNAEVWFGISYSRWSNAVASPTPFWFGLQNSTRYLGPEKQDYIERQLKKRWTSQTEGSIPINLEMGADREKVLEQVVCQLKAISDAIEEITLPEGLS